MEHPEKLERLNPALVDKMIRTEDAVARGRAELARQELLRAARPDLPQRSGGGFAVNTQWNVGQVLFGVEITLVAIAFEILGAGALGAVIALVGLVVSFSGLIAKARTGP